MKRTTLLLLALALLLALPSGCDDPTAKQTEAIKAMHKTATETQDIVKGNANTLTEVHENTSVTLTQIHKEMTQLAKSGAQTARDVEAMFNTVNNVTNSSLLMFGIVGVNAVVSLALIAALVIVIVKLIRNRMAINRVIAADDNDLDQEKWERHLRTAH